MPSSAHCPFNFGQTFLLVLICPTCPQFLHFLIVAVLLFDEDDPAAVGVAMDCMLTEGMGEPGVAADSGDIASPAKLPTRLPLSRSRASRRSLLRSRRLSSWTSLQGEVSFDTFVPLEGGRKGWMDGWMEDIAPLAGLLVFVFITSRD